MNQDNRRRALHEVVSLDAWYDAFTQSRRTSALHVDVAFHDGRIGGDDPSSEVSFRLRLRRAEVVVVIPDPEPLGVDKASVSRDSTIRRVKRTETRKESTQQAVEGSAGFSLNPAKLVASVAANIRGKKTTGAEISTVVTEQLAGLRVLQVQTSDGHYAWRVEPVGSPNLEGRPWNAKRQPRLKLKDIRAAGGRSLEPEVNLEVRCRKEDLEITEIMLKDGKRETDANKLLAATIEIRNRLVGAGLLFDDHDHPYAVLTLNNIRADAR